MATEQEDPLKTQLKHKKPKNAESTFQLTAMQTTMTKDTHKQKNNVITSPIPNNEHIDEEQKLKEQLHPLHPFILSTPGKENDTNYRTYPLLLLEIINSWMLPKGLTLKINPFGLENSLRSVKDGITYFGFQEETETAPYYVDYLIIPDEQDYDDKFIGRHFQISFENASNKYYIKDLGHGLGTFIKMVVDLKISDKHLIKIGDTDVVFSLSDDNEIKITVVSDNDNFDEYEYTPGDKEMISIGRDIDCDVCIEDNMLSRLHCVVRFNKEAACWELKDGNGFGKKSTNGTWVYVNESTMIEEGMIFKSNHNLFECKYKYVI